MNSFSKIRRWNFRTAVSAMLITLYTCAPVVQAQTVATGVSPSGANAPAEPEKLQTAAEAASGSTPSETPPPSAAASTAAESAQAQETESQAPVSEETTPRLSITKMNMPTLKGTVKQDTRSPFIAGAEQVIPEGTKLDVVMPADCGVLNSEVSQIGDEVTMRIAADVGNGRKVFLPKGWYMRGLVTRVDSQKRMNRQGIVQVDFDKIITPDGEYEVKFDAKYSSKESAVKTVARQVATSSGYMAAGGAAGALLSIQFTGIGGAIATQGYSVAIGAGIGAAIGAIGFMKKKGQIKAFLPGDTLSITTSGPITVPGLNPEILAEAAVIPKLEGLDLKVNKYKFRNNSWDDKTAKLLDVDLAVKNNTKLKFHFYDLYVMSDYGEVYNAYIGAVGRDKKSVLPNASGADVVTFLVGSPKRKYSLCFSNRRTGKELNRIPIN